MNVPLAAGTGESAWLAALRSVLPPLAAAFGPDLIVSQHGADAHAWDPLAHLRVTTTAMGVAARLVDEVAHRWADGRWLATGGGGYDVYRVVPRAWALTWLAGAHREAPESTPRAWRERWTAEADRLDGGPLPTRFADEPNAGLSITPAQEAAEARSLATAALVRSVVVPRLLREADARGWWSADARPSPGTGGSPGIGPPPSDRSRWAAAPTPRYAPAILERLEAHVAERLTLAARVIPPLDSSAAAALLVAATRAPGVKVTAAVDATTIVGLVISALSLDRPSVREVIAIGVAPGARQRGLASRMIAGHRATLRPGDETIEMLATVAERDVIDPLPGGTRREIALRLIDPPRAGRDGSAGRDRAGRSVRCRWGRPRIARRPVGRTLESEAGRRGRRWRRSGLAPPEGRAQPAGEPVGVGGCAASLPGRHGVPSSGRSQRSTPT